MLKQGRRLTAGDWQWCLFVMMIITKLWGLWVGGWFTLVGLLAVSVLEIQWLTKLVGGERFSLQNWLIFLAFDTIWLPLGLLGLTSTLQTGITLSATFQNELFATRDVWLPIVGAIDVFLILLSVKWLPALRANLVKAAGWQSFWLRGWRQSFWKTWWRLFKISWLRISFWLLGVGSLLLLQWLIEVVFNLGKWISGTAILTLMILWSWLCLIQLVQLGLTGRVEKTSAWWFLLPSLALAIGWLVPFTVTNPSVIAHRGVDANDGVQNTTQALTRTVQRVHPRFVEIDIQQTADHHFIVLHDETLWHLARRRARAGHWPLKALEQLPVQENGHVAKLSSLRNYQRLATKLKQPLIVEIKVAPSDSPNMVNLFKDHYAADLIKNGNAVHSLDYTVVDQLKKLAPGIRVGYITPFNLTNLADNRADFYSLQSITLSREQVLAAHRQHKPVYIWTVDQPWSTGHCWGLGVDGLITDRASQTRSLFEQRQHYVSFQLWNWLTQLL